MTQGDYEVEVRVTLTAYAKLYGRKWKERLLLAWYNGDYGLCTGKEVSALQGIRNHPSYGHEYLKTFRLEK